MPLPETHVHIAQLENRKGNGSTYTEDLYFDDVNNEQQFRVSSYTDYKSGNSQDRCSTEIVTTEKARSLVSDKPEALAKVDELVQKYRLN